MSSHPERTITDVELAGDDDAVAVRITQQFQIPQLFNANGELRLWEDDAGWSGYLRREADGEPAYYEVNTRHDYAASEWIFKMRVNEGDVRDAIREHIRDPQAGGVGNFQRRSTPR